MAKPLITKAERDQAHRARRILNDRLDELRQSGATAEEVAAVGRMCDYLLMGLNLCADPHGLPDQDRIRAKLLSDTELVLTSPYAAEWAKRQPQ